MMFLGVLISKLEADMNTIKYAKKRKMGDGCSNAETSLAWIDCKISCVWDRQLQNKDV